MAETELFRRLESWREQSGLNPSNGSKRRELRGRRDETGLIVSALRVACRYGSPHLLAEYRRLLAKFQAEAAEKARVNQ